jgi:hypothetical protein
MRDEAVDFVLSDYLLEGESYRGDYVVDCATRAGLPAALMSADAPSQVQARMPRFLSKPFEFSELVSLIQQFAR